MSFLAGRLASTEGAYFLQESKKAVTRLLQHPKNTSATIKSANSNTNTVLVDNNKSSSTADVLPEVLRHSLPSKIFLSPVSSSSENSSFTKASKWAFHSENKNVSIGSTDALNPLRAYVSLPQVTFGPKRWQLPNSENSILASTANDLRSDKYTPINPEKLKAAAAGLSRIGSAFAVATAIVFGGATLTFGLVASKLELHNTDDIRTRGKDLVRPRMEMIREQLIPLRTWAEDMTNKWHLEREESFKEKPLAKELSRILGAKTSN
ncbi:unnamed protein product [Fraxinus pennsylvanica]|uniref:Uncharacterized protein n=1 Tax=Fraxinus pennsylvanica TaxID=56036 RepID=A0AAD1ZN62_9LAMI|nr:unnamed protein product [Fraxinus pennsylvanica]